MLKIRKATDKDYPEVLEILEKLDLYYSTLEPEDFFVAEKEDKIVGCVQLQKHKDFLFLGSLATIEEERNSGVARALLKSLTKGDSPPIYLYTIIPEFFEKFGFKASSSHPNLPSKNQYECTYCDPNQCVCMVKYPHAA
ncbi:MAG: GNAT family N-acetyltransferase [Candidatus Saganbacteria bacterium]|nr:GNAT family N-acetyltransferase [Candidatus Saganbacteria bacterium]